MRYLLASLFLIVAAPAAAQTYLGHPDTAVERLEHETMDFGFGQAVVLFDDQLIVGAETPNMGSYTVIAYRRVGDGWVEFQRFQNEGGIALARVGDLLAIGAHEDEIDGFGHAGAVKLYAFDAGSDIWALQETLVAPTPAESAYFGQTLAVVDDTLYVGEPYTGVRPLLSSPPPSGVLGGRVHAFRDDGGWSVVQTLAGDADDGGAGFGAALAATDRYLVVGAPGEGGSLETGVVYWYELTAGAATRAGSVENPGIDSRESPFGHAVDVHGDRLLVGATMFAYDDTAGHGAARLYDLSAASAELLATFTGEGRFGWSVLLLDETQALVGAPNANVVHHYLEQDGEWSQVQRVAEPPQTTFRERYFGETLMLAEDELFVGAPSALHGWGDSDGSRVPLPSFSQGGKLYKVPLIEPPLADLSVSVTPPVTASEGAPIDFTFRIAGDASEAVSVAFIDLRTHLNARSLPAGCFEVYAITLRCELGEIPAGGSINFVVTFLAPDAEYHNTSINAYVGSELPEPDSTDNRAATHIAVRPNPTIPVLDGGGGAFGWFGALFLLAMLKSRIRLRRSPPCSARTSVLPDSTPNSR